MTYKVATDARRCNKHGEYDVMVFVNQDGKRFSVATGVKSATLFEGISVPAKEANAAAKTARLAKIYLAVEEFLLRHTELPAEKLREGIQREVFGKAPKVKHLHEFVREYGERMERESTRGLYLLTADKVGAFDGKATFASVDLRWLESFDSFLRESMKINSAKIHLQNLRAVFNRAIDDEVTSNYPFRRFKIKKEEVAIRNLSAQQIANLRDYPVEEWQEIYRDLFMLSFYLCGVNSVDLLMSEGLQNGRFVFRRTKTGKVMSLPVEPEAMRIIEKYKGERHLISPMDTYGRYQDFRHRWNDALRKIGTFEIVPDKAGKRRKRVYHPLYDNVTTYTARYSFASIGAELDIPREHIALCLGHRWADTTSHYIAYEQRKIDETVRKVIDYVNSKRGEF